MTQTTREQAKNFFRNLEKFPPKTEAIDRDNIVSTFWEELYQAFKFRMIAERNGEWE